MECALQKIEPYKNTDMKYPIITSDSSVHFEGQDFDPTHIKRAALSEK